MIVVNRYGLYGFSENHVNFMNRSIKYALLAMQNSDVSLIDDDEAVTLRSIALEVEALKSKEMKYFCIPFLSNQDRALKNAFEAAAELTLIFDQDQFDEDCVLLRKLIPALSRAVQLNQQTCIPGTYVKKPTQLSHV